MSRSTTQTSRPGFTERLARAAATRPWRTLAAWGVLVVLAVAAIGMLLGDALTGEVEFRGKDPDSIIGQTLVEDRLTGPTHLTEIVIVRSAGMTVDAPAFKEYVGGLAARIEGLGADVVAGTATYYATGDSSLVSKDGHATLVTVTMAGDDQAGESNVAGLRDLVVAENTRDFTLEQTGDASMFHAGNELAESDLTRAEIFGVPAALVVLLVVFGAVVAAFMPLALSVIAIILAIAMTALVGQAYTMSMFVVNILTMMGLAVGIDYTLFIISRYREERARGLEKIDAIAATGATANRAIFFSGMTVVLAMLGMVVVPVDVTISLGLGSMFVVFTTLVTTLIALPALMSLLGDHVNSLRIPFLSRYATRQANGHNGIWEKLSHAIMRRPVVWLTTALVILLSCAAPVLWMQTGNTQVGPGSYPDDQYVKQGWDALTRDFAVGQTNPVQIVVDGPANDPAVQQAVADLQAALSGEQRLGPAQVTVNPAGDLTLVNFPLAGDPAGDEAQALIRDLRGRVVPTAFAAAPAAVYVTGGTAFVVDYLTFFDRWLPIAIALVLGLSFVLLLLAFRSVVIPLKAILMNLLSVGAAYGLIVLVFQMGVGADLLGLQQVDAIEAWVPLMLFSMLFGLSMDYQVFLLSRIKERYDHTGDTREAVAHGIGRTAGIITGAAAIMVCVFAGMATGELVMFQQMGFGLAIAIFIDATVVRTIIVPAAMELLGDWNWYLPRWLEWLPNVSVEGRGDAAPTGGGKPLVRPQPSTEGVYRAKERRQHD